MFIILDTWGDEMGARTLHPFSEPRKWHPQIFLYRVRVFETQVKKGWNDSGLREGGRALSNSDIFGF